MSKAGMGAGIAGQSDVDHFLSLSVFIADDMSPSSLASPLHQAS